MRTVLVRCQSRLERLSAKVAARSYVDIDVSRMSDEELRQLRDELRAKLSARLAKGEDLGLSPKELVDLGLIAAATTE